MIRTVMYGECRTITFEVIYSRRRTVGLTVNRDLNVIARVPFHTTVEKIDAFVAKKGRWILKHVERFSNARRNPPKRFVSGETHHYLGRQYTLRVVAGSTESVRIEGTDLRVVCRRKRDVRQLVRAWYEANARLRIGGIAMAQVSEFKKLGVSPQSFRFRPMRSRWGTCSRQGRITLNTELIKAPKGCIEYVIVHELCHLIHPDHSAQFRGLESRMMPDRDRWEEILRNLGDEIRSQ